MDTYEKKYKEALEKARQLCAYPTSKPFISYLQDLFPELTESNDERIRKELIDAILGLWDNDALPMPLSVKRKDEWIAWLEKQGNTNETINKDEFAQGVLRGAAIYLINWIDYNAAEGNMCLSNMECKDIEDSLVSGDWGKIYAYLKKKLEKQGEQKPVSKEYTFKSIPRLLDMIEPTDRAKAYCQKLINILAKEGYNTDAKIVEEVLNGWNGEDVPMAVMDEQKPADKQEPKFQNGQLIVWQNKCYKVNYNGCGYELIDQNGLSTSLEYGTVDTSARLWDITKDARDGDVLYFYNDISGYHSIGLFKRLATKNETYGGTYRCYTRYGGFNEENRLVIAQNNIELCHCGTEACPATKEQRDTLFAKMKEEGWKWDEKTHELKKIEQKPQRMISAEAKEALYDKPAWSEEDMKEALRTEYEKGRADTIAEMEKDWSEEDENYLNTTIAYLKDANEFKKTAEKCITWLKSLKDRYTWRPSEEQLRELRCVISGCSFEVTLLIELEEQLKKLL